MVRRWIARQGWGMCGGLLLTLLTIVIHRAGLTEGLERVGYDLLVRRFSRVPASDRIVHIDIDDEALQRVESWPWPRDLQADIVRVLHELGADRIVVDLVWAEPKGPEVRLPAGRFSDFEGRLATVGAINEENVVFPDDELADAIATAGCVHLAIYDEDDPGYPPDSLEAGLSVLLSEDFGSTPDELAARLRGGMLQASVPEIEDVLPGVKRRVAERLVARVLTTRPAATAAEAHAAILKTPFERQTADRTDVLAAYSRQRALLALCRRCAAVPDALVGRIPKLPRIVPSVYKFMEGARGAGTVGFTPDPDGSTRRVPLLGEYDGVLVEQLGFAVARDVLGIRPEDVSLDSGGNLVLAGNEQRPRLWVPLENGQMLVNWHVTPAGWSTTFRHLPVTQLLRIADCRRSLRHNSVLREILLGQVVQAVKDEAGFDAYRQQVRALLAAEREMRAARLSGRGDSPEIRSVASETARLRTAISREQRDAVAFVDEQWAALQKEPNPADSAIAAEYQRFQRAYQLAHADVSELDRANQRIAAEQQACLERLRPLIAGKICFVGYTATAVADMVTTPADAGERGGRGLTPGVMVHSNVLNSFLVGRFRSCSALWLQAGIIGLLGSLITFVTAVRGPRASLLAVMAVIVAGLAASAAAFAYLDHWLPVMTALVSTFVIWAIVLLLRYLITDRQKRHFSKAVAQYVSPAVARSIADSGLSLSLAPVSGVVTCFFSDLAGFTRLSERLGPEGTRSVLNPYLEAMSGVLHRHGALINKFIGDGIFAFFNPPILPSADHQRAACEAALDCQEALRSLPRRYADDPLAHEFVSLKMRIGIATGHVFVGDYGSEEKLDYTCVGDTVNLASRLESANKAFGSQIMLAGSTYEVVRNHFVCRPLGLVQVKGQTAATPIYELLGRSGEVDGELLRLVETAERAVAAFARREWAAARAAFERCLELRPGDAGVLRHLSFIDQYITQPPLAGWSGAIELTEK